MIKKIIHIARLGSRSPKAVYLFLKKTEEGVFQWLRMAFPFTTGEKTEIAAGSIEEAMLLGSKRWKEEGFYPLACGFKFQLPSRDSIGSEVLFWQMVEGYSSPNGQYFDATLGCKVYVDFASEEALSMWNQIKANESASLKK